MCSDPATPPPEVLAAIAVADEAWRRLADRGRSVRFSVDAVTGRVTAELTGPGEKAPTALTGDEVLSLADGRLSAGRPATPGVLVPAR